MNFILLGLLWLFVAALGIYFINKTSIRTGMAMIIVSFLLGIVILFIAMIL